MNAFDGFHFPEDRERQRLMIEHEKRARIYSTPEFWAAYDVYIRSPPWRKMRTAIIARTKCFCEHCGRYSPRRYQIHHKTYERFTQELRSDLEGLCVSCHVTAHLKSARETEPAMSNTVQTASRRRVAKGCSRFVMGKIT